MGNGAGPTDTLADFGNNTLNESILKNDMRSSVVIDKYSYAAVEGGKNKLLLSTNTTVTPAHGGGKVQ